MDHPTYKIYNFRWIVLMVFMLAVSANQLLWITFAPVTKPAAQYYKVSDLSIGLLSMSFMIVYIFISIPASWVIDTYGFRIAVGFGAVMTGVFGLSRGLAADNYTLVLISQIGIAIGQPFILNAITKVAARWFPVQERATASGFGSLAIYLGILIGMVLTPFLVIYTSIATMLLIYGIGALVVAVIFLLLAREYPPTPTCTPEQEERSLVLEGFKQIVKTKDFILLMAIFFIGLGVFNSVTTWIEDILRPRGFSITQAGITGGVMILAGICGALIMPLLSDRRQRRVSFIIVTLIGATIGLLGLTISWNFWLVLIASFLLGFSLLSAGPIGFQYGAEITYPAPEGASNGLLLLMGQISGIVFILAMDSLKDPATGSMTFSLIGLAFLMVIAVLLSTRLKESTFLIDNTPG